MAFSNHSPTSGYWTFVGRNQFIWHNKKQIVFAHSTLKLSIEYGSSSYTASKILWVRSIHQDIGVVALLLWICTVIIKPLYLFLTILCFMSTPNILRSMVISFGIHWYRNKLTPTIISIFIYQSNKTKILSPLFLFIEQRTANSIILKNNMQQGYQNSSDQVLPSPF